MYSTLGLVLLTPPLNGDWFFLAAAVSSLGHFASETSNEEKIEAIFTWRERTYVRRTSYELRTERSVSHFAHRRGGARNACRIHVEII